MHYKSLKTKRSGKVSGCRKGKVGGSSDLRKSELQH
jgi:hypothetical protein